MRKYQKDQILQLIKSIYEAHEEVIKQLIKNNLHMALDLLTLCQQAVIKIGTIIEEIEGKKSKVLNYIKEYNELLSQESKSIKSGDFTESIFYNLNELMQQIELYITDLKIKYEIVFLPYKSSMWDSLESIWKAAIKDDRCNCCVIPIPYYDKETNSKIGKMHYEGNELPEYVPIINWQDYKIEEHNPDIIYFHNPYDEYNRVTTVHPDYYTKRMRNYCNKLVFVPYYIAGNSFNSYDEAARETYHVTSGVIYSDYIIAQSEVWANAVSASGIPLNKFLILGSPKVDAVISNIKNPPPLPSEWKTKIRGRKVLLFNTSIASVLACPRRIRGYKDYMMQILSHQDILIIWRPHPLLKNTIETMKPEYLNQYNELEEFALEHDRVIYDRTPNMYTSFYASDGLISDMSSVLRSYILTEKPILDLIELDNPKKYITADWWGVYHLFGGVTLDDFVHIVRENNDYNKEKRLKRFRDSIVNADGTCGEKTHEKIIQLMEGY